MNSSVGNWRALFLPCIFVMMIIRQNKRNGGEPKAKTTAAKKSNLHFQPRFSAIQIQVMIL